MIRKRVGPLQPAMVAGATLTLLLFSSCAESEPGDAHAASSDPEGTEQHSAKGSHGGRLLVKVGEDGKLAFEYFAHEKPKRKKSKAKTGEEPPESDADDTREPEYAK